VTVRPVTREGVAYREANFVVARKSVIIVVPVLSVNHQF
jgi:hypothetical protein